MLTSLTPLTPILEQGYHPHDSNQSLHLAAAYEEIEKIIRTQRTNADKIQSIMEIFDDVIEKSYIQQQCINLLEKQKKIILKENEDRQEEFADIICELSNKVELLAAENGLFIEENTELTIKLKESVDEKKQMVNHLNILKQQNLALTGSINHSQQKIGELIEKQNSLSTEIKEVKAERDLLQQQNEIHVTNQKKRKKEIKKTKKINKELQAKIKEETEFQKLKSDFEKFRNKEDLALAISSSIAGAAFGGLPGIVIGGICYSVFKYSESYGVHSIEKNMKDYKVRYPILSKTQILTQILKDWKFDYTKNKQGKFEFKMIK